MKANTPLARRIARLHERMAGRPFPGGVENAYIRRLRPGAGDRSRGAWSWMLGQVEMVDNQAPWLGSQWPAREAVRNPDELMTLD